MKQAEKKAEEKEIEEHETKLKDLSEWKTDSAASVKKKASSKPKIISVGYTSINTLSNGAPIVGRRTFGAKKEDEAKEKKEDGNDIDAVWKKQKQEKDSIKGAREKRANDESPKKTGNKKRKSHPPTQ